MKAIRLKAAHHFFPCLILAGLTLLMTFPLVFHLRDHLPSDLGDPLHHVWLIGRNLDKVKQGFTNFWETQVFYPHHKTLLYGDYVPLLTLMAAVPAWLTKNLILTYNLLWLFSFFLCGLGAYCLVFHFTASRWAGFIAGVIFAFSPLRFAHLSHLELLYSAWLPFSFLFFHSYFEQPTTKNLFWALFFVVIQALSCGHYGLYAALFLGLFGLVLAFQTGFWKKPFFWAKTITGIVIALTLLLPFFLPYFPVQQKMGFTWSFGDLRHYSAEIQDYLAVPAWNRLWGGRLRPGATPEHEVFLGLVPLLFLIMWLSFNGQKSRVSRYRPYFINLLISWFSLKKKCPEKSRRLAFFLFFLDTIIFLLIIDIVVILSTGGWRIELGLIKLSSRRLINPLLFLVLSLLLRFQAYPGWPRLAKKIGSYFREDRVTKNQSNLAPFKPPLPTRQLHFRFDLYLTLAILSWLFSFGPVIAFKGEKLLTGPYNLLLRWIPGFQAIRVPSRFSVMVSLSLAILCGLAINLLSRSSKLFPGQKWLLAVLLAAILIEEVSFPLPLVPVPHKGQPPPIYSQVSQLPENAALLELPLPASRLTYSQEALPMYYSLFHRLKIVNGYSGFIPPAYSMIQEALETFPSEETVSLLHRLNVRFILIHTAGFRPEKGKEIVAQLQAWSDYFACLAQREGDFLYELTVPWPKVNEISSEKDKVEGEKTPEIKNYQLRARASVSPEQKTLTRLAAKGGWQVWASSNVVMAEKAVDNSLETGWSSATRQRRGEFFWIDFGQELRLVEVRLYLKGKLFDYPRNLVIEASKDNRHWEVVKEYVNAFPYFDLETIEDLSSYHSRLVLPPTNLRYLRLKLTRPHSLYHWSIQEIECWGEEE